MFCESESNLTKFQNLVLGAQRGFSVRFVKEFNNEMVYLDPPGQIQEIWRCGGGVALATRGILQRTFRRLL